MNVFSMAVQVGPLAVFRDIREGLRKTEIWQAFAWDEIKNRYRRSNLGLAWIVLSYLLWVSAIAIFFGDFTSLGTDVFVYYVAIGFAAFSFLIGNVTDGCTVFKQSATWIKSTNLPFSIYVFKSITRSLFPFTLQMCTALSVMAVMGWRPSFAIMLVIPGILIFLINAFWIQLLLGIFAARFPDVDHLVSAVTRILFFISPVLWVYDERTDFVKTIANFNPLTHFIEILRAPILGESPAVLAYTIVGFWTVFGWAIAVTTAGRMRHRLPYWM